MTSILSAFPFIGEQSFATPGAINSPLSTISANIAAINSDVGAISGVTISPPSGNTIQMPSDLSISGYLSVGKGVSIGTQAPSIAEPVGLTIGVNSGVSDYLYFNDTANLRSDYLLGSHAGGTADGLNLFDVSGNTMIVSFSKQSIRFYQNVVGPVFDTGGALASTYNAATFIGSGSSLSGIQAAINQAAFDGFRRVYLPANMYPYDASKISFIHSILMVREGGRWDHYDVRAYGAFGNNIASDTSAIAGALNGALFAGGTCFFSGGSYKLTAALPTITRPDVNIVGDGSAVVTIFPSSTITTQSFLVQMNPFTVTQAGIMRGFTLDGTNSATSVIGINIGDVVGLGLDDLVVQNFTGASAVGMALSNITYWTERTTGQRIHLNNNTIGLQFASVAGGGTISFGYTKLFDLRLNVNNNQIGIRTTSNAFLYSSILFVNANVADAGTVWKAIDASQTLNSLFWVAAEQTSGTGGTLFNVASGARISGHGHISNYGSVAGGGSPMALTNANAAGQGASLRIVPIGAQAANWQGVQDSGTIANFGGSGNVGTMLPAIFNQEGLLLAALGMVYGSGVESPFASFYNATGNGFFVYRVSFGQALSAALEVLRVDTSGAVRAYGRLYPGDEAGAQQTSGGILHSTGVPSAGNGTNNDVALSDKGKWYFKNGGTWYDGQIRQTPTEAILVSGIDATIGDYVSVTLTAARVVGAPLTPTAGQRVVFNLVQDGTGGRSVTWNAVFKVVWSDAGNGASKRSSIAFIYDGTNWNQDGAQTPYV